MTTKQKVDRLKEEVEKYTNIREEVTDAILNLNSAKLKVNYKKKENQTVFDFESCRLINSANKNLMELLQLCRWAEMKTKEDLFSAEGELGNEECEKQSLAPEHPDYAEDPLQ